MSKTLQKRTGLIIELCLLFAGLLLVAINILRGSSIVALKPYIAILLFVLEIYFLVRFFILFKVRISTVLLGILFLVLIYFQIRYFIHAMLNPHPKQREWDILYVAFFQLILLVLTAVPVFSRSLRTSLISFDKKLKGTGPWIFILSLVLWTGMVLIYSPITVFTSSWREFDIAVVQLFSWLLIYLIAFLTISYVLYRLVPMELKALLIRVMFIAAVVFWFYTYILPGDFGHLDKFEFSNPGLLSHSVRLYQFLEMAGILTVSVFLLFLLQRFPKKIMVVLVVLNLMAFGQTLANLFSSGALKSEIIKENRAVGVEPPDYAPDLLSFSREQNVLIIMLDMFCGGFIPDILDANPGLYREYEGFTWYANVLSTSDVTYGSIPSMVGGSEYTVDEIGDSKNISLSERYREAFRFYPDFFQSRDFSVSFADTSFLSLTDLVQDDEVLLGESKDFIHYWQHSLDSETLGEISISSAEYSRIFAVIGLFKGSPFLLKRKIYDGSSWLNANSGNERTLHAVRTLALLDLAPELSSADSPRKTFKYISSEFSHLPWSIDSTGQISKKFIKDEPLNTYYPELNMIFLNPVAPFNTWVKTLKVLARWFDWMKKEGIYDNTRIIIVSDHGYSGIDPMFEGFKVIQDDKGRVLNGTGRIHPLLLVKDFYQKGDLVRSDHFVTNSDTAAIATMGISGKDPLENPLNFNSDNRELIVSFVPSTLAKNGEYTYQINGQFCVKANIFEKKNWTDILHSEE